MKASRSLRARTCKEIIISTNSNTGLKGQSRPLAASAAGSAITTAASRLTTFPRKKSKSPKLSAYVSYIAIVTLMLSIISVGYQPPVEGGDATGTASRATIAAAKPSVDQLAAVKLAAVAASTAEMAIAPNVESLSVSMNVKNELAQADESLLSKPQIVATSGANRGIKDYVVAVGDDAQKIAAAHGVSVETIRWANGLTGDAVPVGKVLAVPAVSGVVYTVKPGDTADSLAQRYGADKNRIVTYNDAEFAGLQPGQRIVIPGGTLPNTERPGYVAPSAPRPSYAFSGYAGSIGGGNRYAYGYCTWYVYERRAELGKPIGGMWGDAKAWTYNARAASFAINRTPAPGAILVDPNAAPPYGHVAVVESVNADGSVTVSEMNYVGWAIISSRTIPAGQAAGYNYIH